MNQLYLMDTCFVDGDFRGYPYAVQCAMTAELGMDAILPILDHVPAGELGATPAAAGIELAAVYHAVPIPTNCGADPDELRRTFDRVPEGVDIELALTGSAWDETDPGATHAVIEAALRHAEDRDARIALYPHVSFHCERIEQAVALCRRYDTPRLQAVFCGFHWFAVDGQDLAERIALAAPHLASVNLCGSRHRQPGPGCTIEALDGGTLDNAALLACLHHHGFAGRLGIQGYGIGGDPLCHLERSVPWLRRSLQRVAEHPEWYRHCVAGSPVPG